MKKQLIMFIMALFLVFAMTACGGDPTPGPVDPPIEPNGDETGFFKYIKEDDLLDLSSRTARGTHGVVAAANPYASYAGYYTLQNGDSVTVKGAIIDFISDGTKNNQIYYDVLTISTKSDVNAPNTD